MSIPMEMDVTSNETDYYAAITENGTHSTSQNQRIETKNQNGIRTKYYNYYKLLETSSVLLRCTRCKFIALKPISMKLHQRIHRRKTKAGASFKCSECDFTTRHAMEFNNHIMFHTDDRPYKCNWCEKTFPARGNLWQHIKGHQKNYMKETDNNYMKKLQEGNRSEEGEELEKEKFKQKHVSNKKEQEENVNEYDQNHVSDKKEQEVMKDEKCEEKTQENKVEKHHYYSETKIRNHTVIYNFSDLKLIKCDKCPFIATKLASMKLHNIAHETKAPFQCTECIYKTSFKSHFNAHILTHNTDKPYKCDQCHKCFTVKFNRNNHKCEQKLFDEYIKTH